MKRAIVVALGTGAVISSAAALSVGNVFIPASSTVARDDIERARIQVAAREAHREAIDERYRALRSRCDPLGGARRDACLVSAHAFRGRALLETQAPYAARN